MRLPSVHNVQRNLDTCIIYSMWCCFVCTYVPLFIILCFNIIATTMKAHVNEAIYNVLQNFGGKNFGGLACNFVRQNFTL